MTYILLFLMLLAPPLAAQQITIPKLKDVQELPARSRAMLEVLTPGMSLEEGIRSLYFMPGTVIDFDSPGTAFVRDFNIWLEHRNSLIKFFGVDAFKDVNDVGDLIKFNNMVDTYEEYCSAVDTAYQKHLVARRQMNKLRRMKNRGHKSW